MAGAVDAAPGRGGRTCGACGAALANPQRCRACGAFQPRDPARDHFATLALPRAYGLDTAALERRLVEFARELHPDLAGGGTAERARAVLATAQLHEAHGVLRDAQRRAEYLLRLEGGPDASADKRVPDGFLEAMLDERDELAAALAEGGARLARAAQRYEGELAACEARLAEGFAELARGGGAARDDVLARLRRVLNGMAYWRSLARELREGRGGEELA